MGREEQSTSAQSSRFPQAHQTPAQASLLATSWTPHWMFARYNLRFLKDPDGVFGGTERIHAVARQGLDRRAPSVTAFLSRFHLPDSDLDGLLLQAQEQSAEEAVAAYLERNPARVTYWCTGRMSAS